MRGQAGGRRGSHGRRAAGVERLQVERLARGAACGQSAAESRAAPGRPADARGRARMRIVFLIGMLAALSFDALASQECGKYGMKAVHIWDSIWDWDRVRVNYNCVP